LLTSILAALAILGSLVLSYLNSRALTRQVRELESKTRNVLTGAPIATAPTGVREFDGLSDALAKASELLALRTEQHHRTEQELRTLHGVVTALAGPRERRAPVAPAPAAKVKKRPKRAVRRSVKV